MGYYEYIYHQPNPLEINLFDSQREYTIAYDSIISARGTGKSIAFRDAFFSAQMAPPRYPLSLNLSPLGRDSAAEAAVRLMAQSLRSGCCSAACTGPVNGPVQVLRSLLVGAQDMSTF